MSRKLNISIKGDQEFIVKLKKFTWSDIYGDRKTEYRSEDGKLLLLISLTLDGEHLLPLGSMSQQYINDDGVYLSKSEILPADAEGKPVDLVESMFSTGVKLSEFDTISLDDYFYYEIESSYILDTEDDISNLYSTSEELLKKNKLLTFQYVYYPTAYPLTGILLPFDNKILVMVGEPSELVYIGPNTDLTEIYEAMDEEEAEEFAFEEAW